MAKKQIFAKLGVFVLLALNVAAYWFFWPNYRGNAMKASTQEKGELRLAPIGAENQQANQKPREFPPGLPSAPVAPNIPGSATKSENELREQERIKQLIEHIGKDPLKTPPPPLDQKKGAFPATQEDPSRIGEPKIKLPGLADTSAPKPLPLLKPTGSVQPPLEGGLTSPLALKGPISPWKVKPAKIGDRTQLIALLQPNDDQKPLAQFRILCDRLETTPQQWRAVGNVAFSGGGLSGECQSVTLFPLEPSLVFEGKVQIADPAALGHSFRSERVDWSPNVFAPDNDRGNIQPASLALPK